MKGFIVSFTKVIPWVYLVLGFIYVFSNPPRTSLGDENAVLAILLLIGVLITTFILVGFSYVVEAACRYLKKTDTQS